jgi:threonine aldolase
VARTRRARKILGGGMRQAGVLAAAGMIALTEMVDRLADDHANARLLAEGLARLPGVVVNLDLVQTNIVIFTLRDGLDSAAFIDRLAREGVRVIDMGRGRLRAVTHYGVDADHCRAALDACRRALAAMTAGAAGVS